ncbi:MAG: ParB/RepB/Spo0J family partition protein [Caulobacteraceae bacterium]
MAEPNPRRGLGRGISALIGESEPLAGEGAATPREAPIELLRRNPDQPRRHFDEAELEELTASIREKGVLQPILVRPAPGAPGEYQIVAGERRWRAAQRAGIRSLPVVVRELNDLDVLEIGLIENVQRADLNALEEAAAYKALIERFGRTQEAVAQAVGKSRSHVANALRLLALPEPVRDHVIAGRLSAGHARAIASAPDPGALARTIVDRDLSVRQAEALARHAQGGDNEARPRRSGARGGGSDTDALAQDLAETLGLKVEIADRGGRGEVLIRYRTLEQLDDLCRRLSRP